jgi:peptide/nickel transport system substrate-binding protein
VWEALRYLIDYEGIASSIGRGQLQVHQTDLLAQAIQGTMAQAGVNISIAVGDTKQVTTRYRAREHELVLTSWGPDFLDPEANAGSFAWNPDNSDNAPYKPLAWRNAWEIPELTQRVNALMLETDTTRREQGYIAIEKQLQESSPFICLFQLVDTWATRSTVAGITEGLLGDQIFYFQTTK